jgi:hypothetical protein
VKVLFILLGATGLMYLLVHDLNSTANISGIMYNITDGTR